MQGSGWVIRQGLVATNAHVVAGEEETRVVALNGQVLPASSSTSTQPTTSPTSCRVCESRRSTWRRKSRPDDQVVLLGYPRDGPLTAVAGAAGTPTNVFARTPGRRTRGAPSCRFAGSARGDSGGPVINDKAVSWP